MTISTISTGITHTVDLGNGTYATNLTVTNTGTITVMGASLDGIDDLDNANATITNHGVISGFSGIGIGGTLTGTNSGTISGTAYGIFLQEGSFLNSGTIIGGRDAIYNEIGAFTLGVDAGAIFEGKVRDQAGGGVLNLAGTTAGRLDMGSSFTGFSQINFGSAAWTLGGTTADLANGQTISGLSHGDTIDLEGLAATTLSFANNTLTLFNTGGTSLANLHIIDRASTPFLLTSDGTGGTDITIPCFAAGTRILTTDGEIAVENPRTGDTIVTVRDNGPLTQKIIWTGNRTIDIIRHPDPSLVRPIRIVAGAIAKGVPERDLRLSPEHAVYLNGNLFRAINLINGNTIFQELTTQHVTYHHIELESHDILLAEGLPCESFLDTGNKTMFASVSGIFALHPDFRPSAEAIFCAPLISEGALLNETRDSILNRATSVSKAA